ncbi:MAG: amino acid adenylation domain-containing protein [Desulfobacterales bacterium]|nr:amino acid adenylation domain-containing protein [Desulfobacterales bacterium]
MPSILKKYARPTLDEQEAFWDKRLGGEPPLVELPLDYPRPPVRSYLRGSAFATLEKTFHHRVKAFCAERKTTLFVVLLGALKTLLLRYTGEKDVVVGAMASDCIFDDGKNGPEVFTNALVLRTRLHGGMTVGRLLRCIAETAENAAANRDYPHEKALEKRGGSQTFNPAPIFNVFFALHDAPFCVSEAPVSKNAPGSVAEHIALCDAAFWAKEAGDELQIECEYDAELFEPATIERILGHYEILLEGLISDAEKTLSALPLLTRSERRRLLVEWNRTEAHFPKEATVHELFERQAERTPDAVAVVSRGKRIRYRELNERANHLARLLRDKHHIRPNDRVGLLLGHSARLITGILGVLKAGGAYVPIDPETPRERARFILEDCGARVLLVDASRPPGALAPNCEILPHDPPPDARTPENPGKSASARDLVYVIYTSGSTGAPKGALIEHRSLVNYAAWLGREFRFSPGDSAVWQLSVGFDGGYSSLWGMLLHGGAVHAASEEVRKDPVKLGEYLVAHDIGFLKITPTLFSLLLREGGDRGAFPGRPGEGGPRVIHIGGEEIIPDDVEAFARRRPDALVVNHYGPTEATIGAIAHPVDPSDSGRFFMRPVIGRPISNTAVYILDEMGAPCPIGARGEIHIAGAGLARGYLNRPGLTAEKFIPHPFSDEPGARLYKTGDQGRRLADGAIEFLGRLDRQMKIRGFRVEPREIEAALVGHPAVREAVVTAGKNGAGGRRLIACIVPDRGRGPDPRDLRDFLGKKLPDYMIPSAFTRLEALPLTAGGKIDRRRLPSPDDVRDEPGENPCAPRDPEEEALAAIWKKILGLERIGIHDNFFELGGHSLAAARIINRVRETFHVEMPVSGLFHDPTVAALAERVRNIRWAGRKSRPPVENDRREELVL